ncbi:hypothetical protein TUMSATVNIG1_59710 (plasmid) [Vibrio nigripulchritudo]|uniref:hypothetical protein n=1 Tax=Vibrio nigripulchritudo TaxID=28173 RepID=UPI00190B8CA0|nr:hypothetical protein [Vibrio nigripulchritudo]BCL73985.1 hypothetical protein VNTUMSATTG_59220 [Vibrio nigripulchritudo]BDU35362.1 hypothetical protein TUMSATVNIG1_59710 [Vibrio nigripulchritudo]
MKIRVDEVLNTKELRFGSKEQHGVKWSRNDAGAVCFTIQAEDNVTAFVTLILDGIRAVHCENNSVRFSNPSKQFMEQATVPKNVADILCKELGLEPETEAH